MRADVVGGGWLSGDGVWFGFAGSCVGVGWFVVSIEAVVVVSGWSVLLGGVDFAGGMSWMTALVVGSTAIVGCC